MKYCSSLSRLASKNFSFTGVQEPEYERKTKRWLIKIIDWKVDTLTEDEDKIYVLNNIFDKSKKVVTSNPHRGNEAINNDRSKCPSDTEDTVQRTFPNMDIDVELRIINEKESDLIRTKQMLEQADQQKEVSLSNTRKRGTISTGGNKYFTFWDLSDGGAIYTATSLLRKDLKLSG